ncbi:MAG: roadblock/LC7 domain-containing protein [Pseudomonadota bacterium]
MSTDISELRDVAGFIGACLVDGESGLMLSAEQGDAKFDLEAAGAANSEVVRAKNSAMQALGLDDRIEDILITLGTQYHLIRPLESNPLVFIYLAVDRKNANLGLARIKVRSVEGTLKI